MTTGKLELQAEGNSGSTKWQILHISHLVLLCYILLMKTNEVASLVPAPYTKYFGTNITSDRYIPSDKMKKNDTGCKYSLCRFEQGTCCWANDNSTQDDLDWNFASGNIKETYLTRFFNTKAAPNQKFAYIAVSQQKNSSKGTFKSGLLCTTDKTTLVMTYWKTDGIELAVSMQYSNGIVMEVVPSLPMDRSSENVTVELPPGRNFRILITARNFAKKRGGAVIIDRLSIDGLPCESARTTQTFFKTTKPESSTTKSQLVTTGREKVSRTPIPRNVINLVPILKKDERTGCKAQCDFEQNNMCALSIMKGQDWPTNTQAYREELNWTIFEYPGDLVYREDPLFQDGNRSACVYVPPNGKAGISVDISLSEDRVIEFKSLCHLNDSVIEACCDESCATLPAARVSENSRWPRYAFPCSKGSKKFSYTIVYNGPGTIFFTLDSIKLKKRQDPNDPLSALVDSCDPNN